MFYHLEVWGCQMNEHDADKITSALEAQGYQAVDDHALADVVVFLTCCVRQKAQDKVYARLGRFRAMKEDRPGMLLALGGCLAQQPGEAAHLLRRFPWLDLVFGTHNLHRLPDLLEEARSRRTPVSEVWEGDDGVLSPVLPSPKTGALKAYIDIMQGCDNFCSYCIVPFVRGRERSRPAETGPIQDLLEFFRVFVDRCHHSKEEELLFPELEKPVCPNKADRSGSCWPNMKPAADWSGK